MAACQEAMLTAAVWSWGCTRVDMDHFFNPSKGPSIPNMLWHVAKDTFQDTSETLPEVTWKSPGQLLSEFYHHPHLFTSRGVVVPTIPTLLPSSVTIPTNNIQQPHAPSPHSLHVPCYSMVIPWVFPIGPPSNWPPHSPCHAPAQVPNQNYGPAVVFGFVQLTYGYGSKMGDTPKSSSYYP